MLDITDKENLNRVFCNIIGIKPIKGILYNKRTKELKTYTNIKSTYKLPKNWNKQDTVVARYKEGIYPDFTEPTNFCNLLNTQWYIFGCLGEQYKQMSNENFQCNYLYNKIQGIQTMLSYGGSESLDEFVEQIHKLPLKVNC